MSFKPLPFRATHLALPLLLGTLASIGCGENRAVDTDTTQQASTTSDRRGRLVAVVDYSDTFTGVCYNCGVESDSTRFWLPYKFTWTADGYSSYPTAATGNPGAVTGLPVIGINTPDLSFPYGKRANYTVQADAILPSNRFDISSLASAGATISSGSSLSVFFRRDGTGRPGIGIFNGTTETDTGLTTGITDSNWHNFAVNFDQAGNHLRIYVEGAQKGDLDLTTFARGAYRNYSNAAVGMGYSGSDVALFADNFIVGAPSLIQHVVYSDTFTQNTVRTDGLYNNNSAGAYNVEVGPGGSWQPTGNLSFKKPTSSGAPALVGAALGNPGAATGLAESGGNSTGVSYDDPSNNFVVQADAIIGADLFAISSVVSPSAGLFWGSQLSVLFRRDGVGTAGIGIFNGATDTPTTCSTGIPITDQNWHNFAVNFDIAAGHVRMYVDRALRCDLDLASFAGGAYQTYSKNAVGIGGYGGLTWIDNFQAGPAFVPGSSLSGIQVARLEVDHRGSSSPAYVNFPIHARIGLKGSGAAPGLSSNIQVTLGLIKSIPTRWCDEDCRNWIAAGGTCTVGGTNVNLYGDGQLTWAEFDAILPPECGSTLLSSSRFWVLVDGVDGVSQEPNKYHVFQYPGDNANCQTTDPNTGALTAGCVIPLLVNGSPGLDIAMLSATPSSSVAVLYPSPLPGEADRPLLTVNSKVTQFGRDRRNAGSENLPSPISFTYDIMPSTDTSGIGWKPLFVPPEAVQSLSTLVPGTVVDIEGRVYPTQDFRNLTGPGGAWTNVTSYKIRSCTGVLFPEAGDPLSSGADGKSNNCTWFYASLVRGNPATNPSNSYSGSWGSADKLQLQLDGTFINTYDTTGAYANNKLKGTVKSFFGNFTLFEGWGNGQAVISPTALADLDYGLKIFGTSVLSDGTSAAATVGFTYDNSYAKDNCVKYTYGFVLLSADLQGCFNANAGMHLNLSASAGGHSTLEAVVRPTLSSSLSVTASVNAVALRLSLTGALTLLSINPNLTDGVHASVGFDIKSLSPVRLDLGYNLGTVLSYGTLNGHIDSRIEQLSVGWCSQSLWITTVYYPCPTYQTLDERTLFSFPGYQSTQTLLSRAGMITIL